MYSQEDIVANAKSYLLIQNFSFHDFQDFFFRISIYVFICYDNFKKFKPWHFHSKLTFQNSLGSKNYRRGCED